MSRKQKTEMIMHYRLKADLNRWVMRCKYFSVENYRGKWLCTLYSMKPCERELRERQLERVYLLEDGDPHPNIWSEAPTAGRQTEVPGGPMIQHREAWVVSHSHLTLRKKPNKCVSKNVERYASLASSVQLSSVLLYCPRWKTWLAAR